MEIPHVQIGTHPIETGDYIIPTKEVLHLMGSMMRIVNNRLPGMIVYGRPRIGRHGLYVLLLNIYLQILAHHCLFC